MKPTLYIITGETAVGKTSYAINFALKNNAEIISCDASLVYRGMNIGTAKPGSEEMKIVPHHLIDLVAANVPFDIVDYDSAAKQTASDIRTRGKNIVVTGGSGFYLKSYLSPVIDSIHVSDTIRKQVAALYGKEGLDGLLLELRKINPEGTGNLDTQNPRRASRALERCLASGKPLIELQADFASQPEPYSNYLKHIILLERNPDELKIRIAKRTRLMLDNGLVEEVRKLKDSGFEKNPAAANAIGYRETLRYLSDDINIKDLETAITQNTLHLAKKQRTWFRTQIREPDERILLRGSKINI